MKNYQKTYKTEVRSEYEDIKLKFCVTWLVFKDQGLGFFLWSSEVEVQCLVHRIETNILLKVIQEKVNSST